MVLCTGVHCRSHGDGFIHSKMECSIGHRVAAVIIQFPNKQANETLNIVNVCRSIFNYLLSSSVDQTSIKIDNNIDSSRTMATFISRFSILISNDVR